jgi:uncharacterized protein
MLCPVCQVELKIADREGVEIDYCPKCRGVWLDRGELDKLLDRGREYYRSAPPPAREEVRRYDDDHYEDRREYGRDYEKSKRKRGFFDDVFDIFD